MGGIAVGFVTIGAVIALGFVLAHLHVVDQTTQHVLVRISFLVATPALLIDVLGSANAHTLLSGNLIDCVVSIAVAAAVYLLVAKLLWDVPRGERVIGALSSSYVNSGNLGLPIAAYALGNAAFAAPMMLAQLLALQPVGLAALDAASGQGKHHPMARRAVNLIGRALSNPVTIGSLLGLALSVSGWQLPEAIAKPIALVGDIAVPGMLIAFGISLRLDPRPGRGQAVPHVAVIVAITMLVQPLAAYLFGRWPLGMSGHELLAVTVIAALPTAQTVFLLAAHYRQGVLLARDSAFVSTLLAVPVILVITALLS